MSTMPVSDAEHVMPVADVAENGPPWNNLAVSVTVVPTRFRFEDAVKRPTMPVNETLLPTDCVTSADVVAGDVSAPDRGSDPLWLELPFKVVTGTGLLLTKEPGPAGPGAPSVPSIPFVPSFPSFPFVPFVPFVPGVPASPFGPCGPVEPVSPFAPVSPLAPCAPAAPPAPFGPVAPLGPRAPVAPVSPRGPSPAHEILRWPRGQRCFALDRTSTPSRATHA